MAESVDVPIKLPTDASDVSAAKSVVASLNDALKAMGPAAKKGSAEAQQQVKAFSAAAKAAQTAAQEAEKRKTAEAKHAQKIDAENQKSFLAHQAAQQKHVHAIHQERVKAEIAQEKRVTKAQEAAQRERVALEKKAAKQQGKAASAARGGHGEDKGGSGFSLDSVIGGAATAALASITALYAAVGVLAVKFSLATIAAQAFKEATLGAFGKLLGGAAAADKAFKDTIRTADQIGMSYQDALRGVNSLLAKGFKADQAQELVKAMADLKSVSPEANVQGLLLALSQIKGKGILQMEELQQQIAEAGLSTGLVLEEIGKKIGKSAADVRKMISAGKISADEGIQGILAAIQKTTGKPIGKAAEEASKSLGGMLARLEQVPGGLLLMADAGKGMATLKDVLGNVLSAFGPSTEGGKALAASFGKLGDAFATFFSGLTGKKGADSLQTFALGLANVITRVADAGNRLGTVLGPKIGSLIDSFGKALGDKSFVDTFIGAINLSIDALIVFFDVINSIRAAVTLVGGVVSNVLGAISSAATAVYNGAQSIGTNLVNGIIAGISLASPLLAAAVQGLASMTTSTAQAAHKVASPSKEWRDEIGYQLPAGAAEGVYDGAPLMARAANDVAGTTTAAGAKGASSAGMGGGGLTIGQLGPFYARTAADAHAIADEVEARVRILFAELSYA